MIHLKNITYEELLDFATEIVNEKSTEKEDDLTQITKYKELINYENYPWLNFIEGWVIGLANRYNVSIENYIRRKKLENIKNKT